VNETKLHSQACKMSMLSGDLLYDFFQQDGNGTVLTIGCRISQDVLLADELNLLTIIQLDTDFHACTLLH
jgi:hypothetical protein